MTLRGYGLSPTSRVALLRGSRVVTVPLGHRPPGLALISVGTRERKSELTDESYPDDLMYHPEHDWARVEGDIATFGITWYAQDSLGEVVFYDPPEVGTSVTRDSAYAEVESVKAVSDVIAPLSGEIVEVNGALADAPERINEDPYGEGWLVRVRLSASGEADQLLGAAEYRNLLEKS